MSRGKKKKLKAAKAERKRRTKVHDRRAALTRNALVAPIEVDNPYAIEPGGKIVVMRNLRDDPLAAMHAAGQIDQSLYLAARHWQKAMELAEVGAVKAMEMKEAVDGGCLADPMTEAQRKAVADLARARKKLGPERDALVRDIIGNAQGHNLTIRRAAERRGIATEWGRKMLGRKFRASLGILARLFGYATSAEPAALDDEAA